MNFFEHQEMARRRTLWLVILFVIALAGLSFLLYATLWAIALMYLPSDNPHFPLKFWNFHYIGMVAGVFLLIVLIASLTKSRQLAKGGTYVAELLGGRAISGHTNNPAERKLINVVEEMAIASGMPVPAVFVLDAERGINAFAAGHSPQNAAIVVSAGCLTCLTRDELQGVVAHEFSHILNGDMLMNMRLTGVLAGITFISNCGYSLLRIKSNNNDDKKGNPLALIGLGLFLVGALGLLCGRLIQSAISHQREFLADGSAVQFTRNPQGIAGALKKIGGYVGGSTVGSRRASEVSHMFFAQGIKTLFATHPPLSERIRRIEPGFAGAMVPVTEANLQAVRDEDLALSFLAPRSDSHQSDAAAPQLGVRQVAEQAGTITPQTVAAGSRLLENMPAALRSAVSDPLGAVLAVFALLLDRDDGWRQQQLESLATNFKPGFVRDLAKVYTLVGDLAIEQRLPLIELAAPALRDLSLAQRTTFLRCINELVMADGRIMLFEFALQRIVESLYQPPPPAGRLYRDISEIGPDMLLALAMLARAGHVDTNKAEAAFRQAATVLPGIRKVPLMTLFPDNFQILGRALRSLAVKASPKHQKAFVEACCACVQHDNQVTVQEAELLRAITHAIGVPFPPVEELHVAS